MTPETHKLEFLGWQQRPDCSYLGLFNDESGSTICLKTALERHGEKLEIAGLYVIRLKVRISDEVFEYRYVEVAMPGLSACGAEIQNAEMFCTCGNCEAIRNEAASMLCQLPFVISVTSMALHLAAEERGMSISQAFPTLINPTA